RIPFPPRTRHRHRNPRSPPTPPIPPAPKTRSPNRPLTPMFPRRIPPALLFLLAANLPAAEPDLSGPLQIQLRAGRTYTGQPTALRNGRLYLKPRIGTGEAEQGFPRAEIARLQFPGQTVAAEAANLLADGNSAAALPLLEALWRQRAPFLEILDSDDR